MLRVPITACGETLASIGGTGFPLAYALGLSTFVTSLTTPALPALSPSRGLCFGLEEDRAAAYVPTDENVADLGTKPLGRLAYEKALKRMNVKDWTEHNDDVLKLQFHENYRALVAVKVRGAVPTPLAAPLHEEDATDTYDEED